MNTLRPFIIRSTYIRFFRYFQYTCHLHCLHISPYYCVQHVRSGTARTGSTVTREPFFTTALISLSTCLLSLTSISNLLICFIFFCFSLLESVCANRLFCILVEPGFGLDNIMGDSVPLRQNDISGVLVSSCSYPLYILASDLLTLLALSFESCMCNWGLLSTCGSFPIVLTTISDARPWSLLPHELPLCLFQSSDSIWIDTVLCYASWDSALGVVAPVWQLWMAYRLYSLLISAHG